MAGRGRGLNIFKKQLEQHEEAAAAVQPTDTEVTDAPDDSEVEAKLAAVEEYNKQRFADAETCGGSTTSEPSIGTGTFVAPFRTYLSRVYGQDSGGAPSEAPTTTDDGQSELKLPFPTGRGRGMFAAQSVAAGSTSESEKVSDKPPGDTGEETKVSSGAVPKMGRGRGILFTSGEF